MSLLLLLPRLGLAFVGPDRKAQPPHILFVVVDDFGWAEVGYHREAKTPEVNTPTIDALVAEGVELNRHYVHMMCTPSRASLQTGRLPVHLITQLAGPCDINGAIPRNMTGLAAQLKRVKRMFWRPTQRGQGPNQIVTLFLRRIPEVKPADPRRRTRQSL